MIKIIGKNNTAVCYTGVLEPIAYAQIQALCDEEAFSKSKIRIMPDVHAGKGCTIGTTMTIADKIVPGMVGVDIGCGMETVRIAEKKTDFEKLDGLIRGMIPCGRNVRDDLHFLSGETCIDELRCAGNVNIERARYSIGTLGGGNHFIEIDKDEDGTLYIVVHSGSRHIGREVAEYYQEEGYRALRANARRRIEEMIAEMKAEGRSGEIQSAVLAEKKNQTKKRYAARELAYVEGSLFDDYIHDMKIVQHFAALNRRAITEVIITGMGFTEIDRFTTVHNYIDTKSMILRKGSVSAERGEKLIIPINMRDGSLICVGKGNDEWNRSAPHGAGRLMSRNTAFKMLSMKEYKSEMEGIYSTCVVPDTLDESPMAYKSMNEIIKQIGPTAEIVCSIRPVYNFKATE